MASSTKSSDINISRESKTTDSTSMGSPLQKSAEKNHLFNSTEMTTEGSVNLNKADPKNTADHPKIRSQQVNSEDSEKENPNNTVTMNPPVSPSSGDPKKSTDPISTAAEGVFVPNHEVNADSAVQIEGSIPNLVSGEIDGAEASRGGALSNPLVDGSSEIPVSAAASSMGFLAVQSAGPGSDGANVPPPVVQTVVDGGNEVIPGSGDPSPAPGSSKSFLEAASASQPDAVLGTVDFSDTYPTVIFTADECEQVSSFYRFAIIGKFSYGKPSNHMITQQLKSEGFGTYKVHFLNGKHVLINLSSKLLCDKLWMRREFVFAGFPMRMFHWDPFFNFKEEPAVVPLWVKIHALPPQWFDLRSLKTIASSVGEFLKADEPTHNRSRLSFARVCVEVNLKNHLPKKINLQVGEDSVPLNIEFEKVPQYCNYCKHIGHDIHKCYMKNPALKPAVFTNRNFNAQQAPTAAPTGNLKITLTNQATASGAESANHDDGFQTVGKGFKLNRSFPPPKKPFVSNVVSNPFDILSQDEELRDGLNFEASTREPCPLDKDPVATLHNLGHTDPSSVLPASHGPLNNFDQEELIDVVILEGRSDHVGTSKTKVMDNQAYYSADELEGFDNYNSDGSVHSVLSIMISTLFWNIRGIGNKQAQNKIRMIKRNHKFNILALIEPKVDLNTNFFLKRFGFHSVCANVSNHIRLFTETDTKIQILKNTEQMLHVEVNCSSIPTVFFLTVVYGRNTKIQRRDLWDDLLSVSQNQVPWMVGGDFNIILQPEEKKGGAGPIQSDMEEFSDCLLNCNLSDVGFARTHFTWYHDGVWQRLDWILVSPKWYSSFPSMSIRHLPKYQSDHNSLLCQFDQNIAIRKTSFRFQNMWAKHHLFLPSVQESWGIHTFSRGMFKLSEKLVRLKYTLKEWNTHHFVNIFNKIDQAQYAVEVAEKDFDYDPSPPNRSYLNKMNANLTLTLSMEEDFWKQKANMKWMLEGERNSNFFHNLLDPNLVPKIITHEQNNMLCFTPTIDEIRSCVFDMEGDSVAGPDGFGIKFFQICWDIISSDVFDAVVDFFSGSPMPRAFTTTTISLIPKNNNPQSWKDFRPISLCNSTYKIISKILSKRLATILPSFINSAQSGFIKGRNITDNILTAHEVTHDISQSMTNTIIKLDMEKAYDRINWNFIFQVMTRFVFSVAWVNFIKSCISNCWFSILVNGQSAGFFKSNRGIRQGDPLSPLIFAIAADYFSRSIDKMFDRNPTMFYKIKKNVKITHLAYADDILIFLNATKKEPSFALQVLKPPENVITALERIFNKFLWGTSDNRRRLYWAAWSRLCYPTDEGGLGCRDLHDIIRAGICKMWWRFRTSDNIWSNFLMNKYCPRLHPMTIKLSLKSSHVWKNLCDVRSFANTKIFWHSGNGNVSFCLKIPFKTIGFMESGTGGKLVASSVVGFVTIFAPFPLPLVVSFPHGLYLPMGILISNPRGISFVKKNPLNNILRFCWNPIITPTISFFMVRLVNKWIPTPDGLLRRGIYATNFCYCCNDDENIPHLFIHGPVANKVLTYFHNLAGIRCLKTSNINFILANWFGKAKGKIHIFHIIPILIFWFLWCCRNDRRVDNVPFTANRVCERIWNYINTFNHKVIFKNKKFWMGAALIADRVGVIAAPKTIFKCCLVRWSKPQPGWWKLNTDGSARGNPGDAAAGGIIRDHVGKPLIMFSEFLGVRTNNFAELYAIWRGLEFCIDNHFDKVWVEVDSKIALSLIEHSATTHWQLQSIISKIRDFRGSIEIRFSHIFREGNAVAGWLANHVCDRKDFFLHDVFSISGKLLGLIKLDKMSYPYIRSKKTFIS
ncbi:hypothetical protein OROMI_016418 [Orobanche minor]